MFLTLKECQSAKYPYYGNTKRGEMGYEEDQGVCKGIKVVKMVSKITQEDVRLFS